MRARPKAYLFIALGLGIPAVALVAAFLQLQQLRRERPEEHIEALGVIWLIAFSQPWILAFSLLAYSAIRQAHAVGVAQGQLLEVLEIVLFALPIALVIAIVAMFLVEFL